jgi:hypothetical protein
MEKVHRTTPSASWRTPLLGKEGKVLKYNTIYFSSFSRRSTLTEVSGGGGFDLEVINYI